MITLIRESDNPYICGTGLAELSDVANGEKKVPDEYINDTANGITEAFREYAGPLIKGQAPIDISDDGLPVYMRFDRKPLEKKCSDYV